MKKTRCYIYTRVSTAIQVDGYSLDAQKDKLRKYAEFQDMEIVGEYSDEGHSGKNIKGRQEFMRMLNDIEDGKDGVDFVLVFKLSRFGRNAADVLSSLQLMQDYGVNLICVEDGIDSSKEAGKLLISIIAAVAEMERENIRVQTMAGREQKAREGKWNGGFAPYGYKLENGELVIADDEVEVIQMIFDRYIHTNEGIIHYDKKISDLQRRLDAQYDRIDEAYSECTDAEKKQFMQAFIERIDIFPERREDGNWIQNIKFQFPVPIIKEGKEVAQIKGISLDKEKSNEHMVSLEKLSTLETIVSLNKTAI